MSKLTLSILLFFLISILCDEDYYRILGVKRDASKQQIRRAFKKLSLKYHPDKNKDNPEKAKQKFIKIANAYEVLNNDETRKIYDQYGEEGLKQHQQQQNAGQGGNFGGFNFGFNFGGANFDDVFSEFFGGGGAKGGKREFHFTTGGGRRFRRGFQEEEDDDNKNYFENTDIINVKMNSLSKIFNRRGGWFVLFFKSNDKEFKIYSDLIKTFAEKTYGIFTSGAVNCKSDEEICEEFSVRDTPKILYFPDDGKEEITYDGELTWESMFKYGTSRMQNFVRVINKDNYNDFISNNPSQYHVILFTSKKKTPPLFKALSKHFLGKLSFGEIREGEKELCNRFNINKFPSLFVITDEEDFKGELYDGELSRDHIQKFLNNFAYKKKEQFKVLKIRELNLDLYKNKNYCNANDNKNTCFIYFSKGNKLSDKENKLLENLGNKYLNDRISMFYLDPSNYKYFWDSFNVEDKNCKAVILKGKRKKYYPISNEKFNESELLNILDNIISGGGDYKKLLKVLNLSNKEEVGDL